MSRIGKRKLIIPTGVDVTVVDSTVKVKGSLGSLEMPVNPVISVKVENGTVEVVESRKTKDSVAIFGLTNSLINNMIVGVSKGFTKNLELIGVGYRVKKSGDGISMTLGFSHPVEFGAPSGITLDVIDNNKIVVKGADKQLVGQVAANIRKLKKPEPYKGKGIKYDTEVVRRKPGKAGKTGK